ncbi:caspase family protein [Winogradskyella ursingii]|uniref:caspase family protein n=1 Tax=Winogradskyella ursingii TaxID=2686079 RepID=UPI0015CD37FB|nr:caspase family protein [Winogradskyella ursingii]
MKQALLYTFLFLATAVFSQEDSRGSKATSTEIDVVGTKRALVIGVSDYKEDALKLKYADNDAALFKNYLSDVEGIKDDNITLLINEDAVALNIVQELKQLFNSSQKNDVLYLYFAGHGDVVDDFGQKEGFLLASDANAHQEYYSGGVLTLNLLNTVINNLSTKGVKVYLILDACRSGFVFEDGTQKNMGTIQAMFENSSKFLSCGSNELSYESGDLKHGYFTYYLVKGLAGNADANTDNTIIFREIDDYLYDNVNTTVAQKHNKTQTPVVRTKNDRAVFKTVQPSDNIIAFETLSEAIENTKKLAARGITETDLKDKTAGTTIKKFKDAIERKSYYGKSSSSYEIYKSSVNDASVPETVTDKMKSTLLKLLSSEAQELINLYIDGTKNLPSSKEFTKQSKHLEICLELMGEDGFLTERIKASQLLLEAYAIIRTKNYSKFPRAKRQLQQAIKLEPRAAYIHNALGEVYNQLKVYDSAYYHYNKAKNLIGTWEKPVTSISDNFMDQYQFEDAKNTLNIALGEKGLNSNLKLGEINEKQGKYAIAETYYQKALALDKDNTQTLQRLSNIQKLKGNTKASLEYYNKAVKTDSINTFIGYGLLNYITDNQIPEDKAELLLLNAIDYEPENAIVYFEYADFLRLKKSKLSRLRLADSLYRKAISIDPFNAKAYAGRGWLLSSMRKPLGAKKSFEAAIDANEDSPEPYFHYANYNKEQLNDAEKSQAFYLKAIEKNDYFIPAYEALVNLYNSENQQEKTIALLNKAIAKTNDVPDFYHLLGQTYFSKSNYSEAIKAYKKVAEIDPTYVKSSQNLGYSQLETNQIEDAQHNLVRSSNSDVFGKRQKEISEFVLTMAKNKLKFGTPAEAKKLYGIAFTIDNSAETAVVYSNFLYLQGEPIRALEVALPALHKDNSNKLNIALLETMVKAAIDADAGDNANYYYQNLTKLDNNPDMLLAAVYAQFIGDLNSSENYRRRVDQNLLRSNKLKDFYTQNTIDKYILSQ